jgi:hypothetical protein
MPNYQEGKIYKIYSHINPDKCYVGSTCVKLCERIRGHRYDFNSKKKGLITSFLLFEEFGVENCVIELIENYPCKSKEELNAREGYWIKTLNCVNKVIMGITKKETYEKWIEKINKRKINIIKDENQNDIILEIKKQNKKEQDKKYREEHKEDLKEYFKKRNIVRAKSTQIFKCEYCNYETNRQDTLKRHELTDKHQKSKDAFLKI